MFKLPKNDPKDVEFIKRANSDPNWPEDLDKPVDWDTVPIWKKIWFVIGGAVKAITTLIILLALGIAFFEFAANGGEGMDEPRCDPSPQGCYE